MKLNHLLQQRSLLLRQTRLANVAFVFTELGRFADRIARGQLRGQTTVYLADPDAQRAWPTWVAEEGSQSVLDEHFVDQDILDLADLLIFTAAHDPQKSFTFRLEEFEARFRSALRRELQAAGVEVPSATELTEGMNHE
ncbi:MAG TPA: hypothetical protein PLN52_25685 [Opitutaceae bacterium]|nr:hypothetical protein [Opitutaceae bacterium]